MMPGRSTKSVSLGFVIATLVLTACRNGVVIDSASASVGAGGATTGTTGSASTGAGGAGAGCGGGWHFELVVDGVETSLTSNFSFEVPTLPLSVPFATLVNPGGPDESMLIDAAGGPADPNALIGIGASDAYGPGAYIVGYETLRTADGTVLGIFDDDAIMLSELGPVGGYVGGTFHASASTDGVHKHDVQANFRVCRAPDSTVPDPPHP